MSSCIYDDAPTVTVCPGCDFGVCQDCIDAGGEGVCKTCYEERSNRRENSAVQREYVVETAVRRCNYCRAAEEESTVLDEEGYCEACRALPRCVSHEDLIAVGHCKSCRREFCRKCLGFTDVCQACTAKNKTKPLKDKSPTASAAPKSSKPGAGKKAKQTAPMEEPAAAGKKGKAKSKQLAEPDANEPAKKVKKPSRGQAAIEEKLKTKSAGRSRSQIIAAASILAIGLLILVSGMYMQAMSPEAQAARVRDQMIVVHRGVVHYYKKTGSLPKSPEDIQRALSDLNVKGAGKIRIALRSTNEPGTVIYVPSKSNAFMVQGADSKGELLRTPAGSPLAFDQYYDSATM